MAGDFHGDLADTILEAVYGCLAVVVASGEKAPAAARTAGGEVATSSPTCTSVVVVVAVVVVVVVVAIAVDERVAFIGCRVGDVSGNRNSTRPAA